MGSPDFAVESLKAVLEAGHEVCAVVTQPDRPKGRGYVLLPTAVSLYAEEKGIDVYKPEKLKNGELIPVLEKYDPEIIVVAAYGKILPEYVLDYPRLGCVNVHASLLPKYRGASPINFALINGEEKTGITTMMMDRGLDTGDILMQRETEIRPDDNVETLHDRLAVIGGGLLCETLEKLGNGTLTPVPQEGESCYAPLITPETRKVYFESCKKDIINRIRGLSPVPGAIALAGGKNVKIFSAEEAEGPCKGQLVVKVPDGWVRITELAPEGKKRMTDEELLRGNRDFKFDICNQISEG